MKEALLLCKKAAAALKCVSAAVSQHHNVGFQVLFFRDPRRSFRLRAQYAGPQHGGRTSRSALEKSRGARDDLNWLAWSKIREENGKMQLAKVPIPKEWWPDLSTPSRFPGE